MNELIFKYLNKEMTIDDHHRLSKWVEEDPRNQQILTKIELYWESSSSETQQAKDRVWKKLISEIEASPKEISKRHPQTFTWIRVAASVALLVAASIFVYTFWSTSNSLSDDALGLLEKVAPPGKKLEFRLPDGSLVKMNSGTKISYPETFEAGVREIHLTGEAFFDVVRNESKPFIIHTSDIAVEVLGTSFSIQAYENGDYSQVFVESGRVRVSDLARGQSVEIIPDEKATYNPMEGTLQKSAIKSRVAAFGWLEGRLVFEDEELEEVFKSIGRWYGVSISYDKSSLLDKIDKKISINCKACSVYEMMESLSYSYEFEYEILGSIITIK